VKETASWQGVKFNLRLFTPTTYWCKPFHPAAALPVTNLAVVLEVKRHYHADVASALEDQLVKDYLIGYQRTHGIYIVGWYNCPAWRLASPLRVDTLQKAKNKLNEINQKSQRKHPDLRLASVCFGLWPSRDKYCAAAELTIPAHLRLSPAPRISNDRKQSEKIVACRQMSIDAIRRREMLLGSRFNNNIAQHLATFLQQSSCRD